MHRVEERGDQPASETLALGLGKKVDVQVGRVILQAGFEHSFGVPAELDQARSVSA